MSAPTTVPWKTAPAPAPRGAECRVYERLVCELQTTIQPIAARSDRDIVWPGMIRDVSEGGVGLVLGRRFERGAGLAIELPATEERPAETLLAKVMHTTALPGNKWLLGCAFVSRLSEEEVRLVVALAESLRASAPAPQSALAPGEPQVQSPSQPAGAPHVISDLKFEGTTHDGQIVRVPVRRLFLTGAWPLARGTILRLWVTDKSSHPAGTRVQVLACQHQDDGWTVSYRPMEAMGVETLRSRGLGG